LVVNKLNGFFEREESEEKLYRLPPEDVSVPSTAALSLSEMDFSFALAQKPKRKKNFHISRVGNSIIFIWLE
jgi:hypothetical protein